MVNQIGLTQAEKAMMGENDAMLRLATRSAVEFPIANTEHQEEEEH